jgi:hypothetical protein
MNDVDQHSATELVLIQVSGSSSSSSWNNDCERRKADGFVLTSSLFLLPLSLLSIYLFIY